MNKLDSNEKDFEALREEQHRLASRVSRISLLRLTLLVVLVLTVANAFKRLEDKDVKDKLSELYIAGMILDRTPHTSDEFYYLADDPFTALKRRLGDDDEEQQPTPTPTPNPTPKHTPYPDTEEGRKQELEDSRAKLELHEKYEKLDREISNLLREAFLLKLPILGSAAEIDLRVWINALPFLFIFSEAYIFILRKKSRLISVLAAAALRTKKAKENASHLDRLIYDDEPNNITPYSRHPQQLEIIVYTILNFAALGFFADIGAALWDRWDRWRQIQFVLMVFTATFYATAYCRFVSNKLENQVAELTDWSPKQSILSKIYNRGFRLVKSWRSRFNSSISLTTGSLIVLVTLFLATASSSCSGMGYEFNEPQKGYLLFLGGEEPVWSPASLLNYWAETLRPIGRSLYIAGLVIAAITIILLLISLIHRRFLRITILYSLLYFASGTISLFLIADFSFSMFWYRDELFIPRMALWVVPAVLWIFYNFCRRGKQNAQWESLRPAITLFYIPLLISACAFLLFSFFGNIKGLPLYFIGVHLITLGYMQLTNQKSQAAVSERKTPGEIADENKSPP